LLSCIDFNFNILSFSPLLTALVFQLIYFDRFVILISST